MKHSITGIGLLVGVVAMFTGCDRQANQLDQGWTPPVKMTDSFENLVGGVELYKFRDTIMCLQSLEKGTNKCLFLNRTNDSWIESSITVPKEYVFWGTVDQINKKLLFQDEHMENQHQVTKILIGTLTDNIGLRDVKEKELVEDKQSFFGETGTNVQLGGLYLGAGVINGSDVYLPYYVHGQTRREGIIYEGPFNSYVFHSTDSGATWQMEQISNFEGYDPLVRNSKNYYYYFAMRGIPSQGYHLWFSRKPVQGRSWEEPEEVTKTYATVYGHYVAVAEDEMIHMCWMDCRHDMKRFNVDGPNIENDDIVYCHRRDADSGWSKDVNLSEGLLYSYSPSMSVDGNNIVVAWAGIRSAGKHHNEYEPNDIYYVTSKDGGETWTKPLMVTDRAKDGIVSGKPQVMLLNGVIHLFYIQGTLAKPEQLSPSLTKLNQAPWPIYYTQRPFPN